MLIAVLLSAWVVAPRPPFPLTPVVAFAQAPSQPQPPEEPVAKDDKKKKAKLDQDQDQDPDQDQDQDQDKQKKPKKKKVAKDTKPAPDDLVDDEADPNLGGPRFSWVRHPSLRIGDVFRLDLEFKLQEDGHSSYGPVAGLDTWEFHRNRFGIKGFLTKMIDYEVEYEFTEKELTDKDVLLGVTPKSQWKDVNVNLRYFKKMQIQVGKFKVPFGLDELTGVSHNDYVYRSLGANYLAPGRDIGTMVHGSFFKHGLTYATGVFEHDGDNATSKKIAGGGATFATRVTVSPFRALTTSPLGNVNFGSAFAISHLSDDPYLPNGLRGRTIMTQDTFFDSVYVKGHRRRWEADGDWTVGPASLRSEYTWVSDDRLGQGIGDEDLPDARARSWYVSGTWILTGEDKRRPVKAAEPFAQGGIGAVELAARYERMWFDSVPGGTDEALRNPRAETILPSGDHALTLGVSWTLNRFTRILVNGIREQVEDPERNPVPNGAAFWSRVIRLQLVF
jgi:phosphate-selective porin OprO/OprP